MKIQQTAISYKEQLKNLNITWKNPPKIEDLKRDIQEATSSYNAQRTKVDNWLKLINPEPLEPSLTRSRIQPKVIRKFNEWRYPSLEEPFMSTEDMFTINPVTYLDEASAKQHEKILNKQFRYDINKTKFINRYIRTAVDTGTVIVKLNWITEEAIIRQEVMKETLLQDPQEIQMYLQQLLQTGQIDEQSAMQILQSGQSIPIQEKVIENKPFLIKDCPTLEVKDARNCYIDPACAGDLDKAKYIVDKFYTDIATLKKDKRFKNLDYITIADNIDVDNLIENKDDYTATYPDKARKKLEVFEYWGYWDIEGNDTLEIIRVFWVGDTIIRMERNPYPDKKFPYVIVQYMPVANSIYGEPDAALLEDNQHIIGALTRGTLDLMAKSANAQRAFKKGALDLINEKRMRSGEDFAFNEHTMNPNDIFFMYRYPELPNSVFNLMSFINNESESITGVKPFSSGITQKSMGDSVGGVRSVMDATAKREAGILRRLSEGLKEIGRKLVVMNTAFLSDETILRITDDEDIFIKRDDFAHSYDLSISISTAESDHDKANKLSFMLQTLGNNIGFEFTQLILAEIADLMKMPALAKKINEFQPTPDPLAQQKAQLEVALLEAQVANERAKAGENEIDIKLKDARTQSELAKAGKIKAEKDNIDLQTLNDYKGISHNRNMEKLDTSRVNKDQANFLNRYTKEDNIPELPIEPIEVPSQDSFKDI